MLNTWSGERRAEPLFCLFNLLSGMIWVEELCVDEFSSVSWGPGGMNHFPYRYGFMVCIRSVFMYTCAPETTEEATHN